MRGRVAPPMIDSSTLAPPLTRCVRSRIKAESDGHELHHYLTHRFTYLSGPQWQTALEAGKLTVNGAVAALGHLLHTGDELMLDSTDFTEPPAVMTFDSIYHDDHLMIVSKPGNLTVHPAGMYFNHTLWALVQRVTGLTQIHIITRLDRETSGLVLIALTPEAAKQCQAAMIEHTITKKYLTVLEGHVTTPQTISGWLTKTKTPSGAMRMALHPTPGPKGKRAETTFKPLSTHLNEAVTLVEATPTTGRLHQIRATASAMGHPVVGDKLYGPDPTVYDRFRTDAITPEDRSMLRISRQALHAAILEFPHPITREPLRFEAPMPADMQGLLER